MSRRYLHITGAIRYYAPEPYQLGRILRAGLALAATIAAAWLFVTVVLLFGGE